MITLSFERQKPYLTSRMLICQVVGFALTACGGGGTAPESALSTASDDGRAQALSVSASTADTVAATAADTKTKASAPDSWTLCAAESGWCAFTGTMAVRYGAGTSTVQKTLTGGTRCDNDTFGDPVPYTAKSCWIPAVPVVVTEPVVWVACANENGLCSFTGAMNVRYGAGSSYVTREMTGPVNCNNATFGDPIVGVAKACSYSNPTVVAVLPVGDPCETIAALPSLPASYNVVTSFCKNGHCAKPDDDEDDTDAIDEALNQSAGKFIVFPPGKYLIKRSLRVKQAGVTLWGPGATIHATNTDDQSIIFEANNGSIYSFRLTAVTAQRGSRVEHTRIAIYGPASVNPVVKNTTIRNNQIVNAGDPGTALANSATGAGIFVNAADGFVIAGNTVARSLADGIHMTGGARNGRVLDNTVRETGDDMIAMVSYAYPDPWTNVAATIAPNITSSIATYQDRNILVANNRLSGQYWGRGIAVVGGRDITIRGNSLTNIPYAAAVLLARETQSGTYGLDNVLVERNVIRDVQTQNPPYDFGNKFASAGGRTGHGAIELHSSIFVDELPISALVSGFTVSNVAIQDNTIASSATPGVRLGVGTGSNWMMGTRPVTGNAPIRGIGVSRNAMTDIRTAPYIQNMAAANIAACSANTLAGSVQAVAACTAAAAPAVTGASMTCTAP